jgi:hypothetical protein
MVSIADSRAVCSEFTLAIAANRQAASSAFSACLTPLLNGFASQGLTRRAMVFQLNGLAIKAPRGGVWSLGQVQQVIIGTILLQHCWMPYGTDGV